MIFTIGEIIFGILLTLIGFKVYNPFKGRNEPEKEVEWYKRFGTLFKIGGPVLIIAGLLQLI